MKNLFKIFFLVLFTTVMVSQISAAGRKTTVVTPKTMLGGVLQVPKTTEPPTIDGQLDPIWNMVTSYSMNKFEGGPADTVVPYDDHYATFRFMWDEDNVYYFVQVVDDTIKTEINTTSPWLNDCVEIFFDGDNAKATSYDNNDIQWRWVYGETPGTVGNAGNGPGTWAWYRTSSGYNFELAIPKAQLLSSVDSTQLFPLENDQEIGFEISNGDLETATSPQTVLHWWTNIATTWNNPSLFGTAVLTGNEISSSLKINYTADAPTIDGVKEEGDAWDAADEISLLKTEGAADINLQDSIFETRLDHQAAAWTLWDAENFYAFVSVIDDTVKTEVNTTSPWLNDCVEMFFDGDNAKATSYDNNDIQWRWVYGETPGTVGNAGNGPGNWVWKKTALGYDFELAIPKAQLISSVDSTQLFPLENDQEIGFEISNGDLETATSPQRVLHWWTNVATTWNNPSLFGTALLVGSTVGVREKSNTLAKSYKLDQNYPNPFNPTTKITFSMPEAGLATIKVYNVLGQEVATILNKELRAGTFDVDFNASNLQSGVYFYQLTTKNISLTKKMMLLK